MFWFWGPEVCGDLSSPPRDQTLTLCIGRRGLDYWTARQVLMNTSNFPVSLGTQ